ncbi:MAG: PQQ-binding-like beta-propeller repeat protein [Planctomycetes bacterium]|nr:PQQ-binding-like beta-propeller repeat protein [Planctomycetota bacterium]
MQNRQQFTMSNTALVARRSSLVARVTGHESRVTEKLLGFLMLFVVCSVGIAEARLSAARDWPTYRSQITRSGVTSETVGPRLFLQWKYIPTHRPKPAWPMPSEELPRMHNDNAYHVVIAGNNAYFGSCITNKVYSIDAAKGKVRWTFFTQGPVRFAPAVYDGRVYVGSDDGYVYCLDTKDGSLIWKYRAGPSDEKVIGNGRMISLWPVRTGVLVDNGIVYFAAGVFPYEGLYICALKAEDGSVVWKNDTIGDRAHELEFGGISPHGYLVASRDVLYVPSGRSMPAAFDRKTGKFLFCASPGGKRGGTWALIDNDKLISGVDYSGRPHKVAYDVKTGRRQKEAFAWFPGIDMVLTREVSYVLTKDRIYAINRTRYVEALRKADKVISERKKLSSQLSSLRRKLRYADEKAGKEINRQVDELTRKTASLAVEENRLRDSSYEWRYSRRGLRSVILAGDVVFAGGEGFVVGINSRTGKQVWKSDVNGAAVGLAASGGRLIVSSDKGPIYCFGRNEVAVAKEIKLEIKANPYPNDSLTETYKAAAEKILAESGIKKGYALVLDCGQGRLAYELAKKTELKIVGLEKDPEKLAAARKNLEAAGLLGKRVVVEPWDIKSLPDYFANLLVSDGMLITGRTTGTTEEGLRILRPWGGTACLSFHRDGEVSWRKYVRGPLEGAGAWTQQYGDPQNTSCSGDELVYGPLGVLWFGEPGPQGMTERHARAQSPVSMNGRLFMQGEELIMAVDAFNGTLLWKREIPGAVRVKVKADSGNLTVTEDGLYVAAHDKCYRLDLETGETIREYKIPPSSDESPRRWGYISVVDNILYGSAAKAMDEDYGAILKRFVVNGKWKNIEDVPQEHRVRYEYYKKLYPGPKDLLMAAQRGGIMYRYMTSFARGGEFLQKNAVTDNLMVSDKIFAMDTETGKLLWKRSGKKIANITITLGDGKIFYADSGISEGQRNRALKRRRRLKKSGVYKEREGVLEELREKKKFLAEKLKENKSYNRKATVEYLISSLEAELFKEEYGEGSLTYDDADVRNVFALDAVTGKLIWRRPVDLTGSCGDKMGAAYSGGLLLFFGNHGNHDAWRFREGGLKWRRITALSTEKGDMVWSRALNYRTRPVIVGDKIILEPRACDLHTGEIVMRDHPITGEKVPWEFLRPGHTCGITAASAKGLFYRSACTAFYDLEQDNGVTIFGAYRPGCAISMIPASGLLLSQEASAGCTCSYPIRCSLVMKRKPNRTQPWTVYVTPGALRPVKRFAINFGAAADMKDNEGTVWFSYPNPKTNSYTHFPNYGVKFDLRVQTLPGMGYFCRDFKGVSIADTDKPWLFTSGCRGMLRCEVPLIDDAAGQKPAVYTVRLGFNALPGDHAGQRVFDIKLQDKMVLENFDILEAAGKANRAVVKEFKGVRTESALVLELLPKSDNPQMNQAPVINFIEVIREDAGEIAKIPGKSM